MAAGDGGSIIMVSSTSAIRPAARRHPLRGGQGRGERDDRGLRPRLRAQGARELHHAGPVPHRHLEGLGPRGLPRARPGHDGARPRGRAGGSRRRRALLRVAPPRASPPARCSAFTEESPDPSPVRGRGAGRARAGPPRRGARLGRARGVAGPAARRGAPGRARPSRGAPVPERLGQPHVSAPGGASRGGAAPASVRRDRAGCPRHEARVQGALAALARTSTAPRADISSATTRRCWAPTSS